MGEENKRKEGLPDNPSGRELDSFFPKHGAVTVYHDSIGKCQNCSTGVPYHDI
jgi:hypothetical protein